MKPKLLVWNVRGLNEGDKHESEICLDSGLSTCGLVLLSF
jgi:hypothetical protein